MKCLILLGVFLGLMSVAYGQQLEGVSNDLWCQYAQRILLPCIPFLTGKVESPSGPCCTSVATFKTEADTKELRRSACQCLKESAPKYGVLPEKAKLIPELCHVDLPDPVDPNVDCNRVQ